MNHPWRACIIFLEGKIVAAVVVLGNQLIKEKRPSGKLKRAMIYRGLQDDKRSEF